MIGQIVSHYRIIEKLGEGGMGVVYVAEDTRLRRRVAIKFSAATPDERGFYARFLREARATSMLSHPHIATVHDYGETAEGRPFIVMELINGKNIGELLRDNALTLQRAVEIVEETAEALAEAHRHGIVHRDVKPTNVMVNSRGEVKVLDFGLAKQLEEERRLAADMEASTMMATETRSDAVVGTLLYLSPEQATASPVDARSDLFALGAMLYECVAGRPAFSGANVIEVCAQIIHVAPPPPSRFNQHVPAELDRIALKALAKRPEDRYQSAEHLIADLRAVLPTLRHATQQIVTQRVPPAPHTPRVSALTSLSAALRQPRFSPFFFVMLVVIAALTTWGVRRWINRPHVPPEEARHWYSIGESALRDGTYHRASNALEKAVAIDGEYALARARLAEAWMEMDYSDKAKDEILRVRALVPDYSALPELDGLRLQAITDTVERRLEPVISNYIKLTERTSGAERAYAFHDLGRAYEKNEEIEKAIKSYVESTNFDSPSTAASYLRLGALYGRQQKFPAAFEMLNKAENLYNSLGIFEGVTEVLYQRGALFNRMGKTSDARGQVQRALGTAQMTTNNKYQQINALLQLSNLSLTASGPGEAQQQAEEAVNLASESGMDNLHTLGLIALGNASFAGGDYERAEEHFQKAVDSAKLYKGRRNEAAALLSRGNVRIKSSKIDEGLQDVKQALEFFTKGDYRKEATDSWILIGRANRQKGNYALALQAFEQRLEIARRANDVAQQGVAHEDVGSVLFKLEEFPKALRHYEESYKIAKQRNDKIGMGYCSMNIGKIVWRFGRYEEARVAFAEATARAALPTGNYKPLLDGIQAFEIDMLLSEGHYAETIGKARKILDTPGKQDPELTGEAKRVLGLALAMSGKKREGRALCEEALTVMNKIGEPTLISKALLSLAEATIESDPLKALEISLRAQERFAGRGQTESEWRALLVAALAALPAKDGTKSREYSSKSVNVLSSLEERWGKEYFNNYLARPDIKLSRGKLNQLISD